MSKLRRRMTVNDYVDQVLEGTLKIEQNSRPACDGSMNKDLRRMSNLYGIGIQHKLSKRRARQAKAAKSGSPLGSVAEKVSTQHHQQDCKSPLCQPESNSIGSSGSNGSHVNIYTASGSPWYVGYTNSLNATPGSPFAHVPRYGAEGTLRLMEATQSTTNSPSVALNKSQSMVSLPKKRVVDEWSEPLHGAPSLWPEDSAYVSGAKLDFITTRGSTSTTRIQSRMTGVTKYGERIKRADDRQLEELNRLEEAFQSEKRVRACHSEALRKKHREERMQHREIMLKEFPNPHGDFRRVPIEVMTDFTVIRSPEKLMFEHKKNQIHRFAVRSHELKWKYMRVLLQQLHRQAVRRPLLQTLDRLLTLGTDLAAHNSNHFELTREQFVTLLSTEFPTLQLEETNRLFSAFDPGRTDQLDLRDLLATIRGVRQQRSVCSLLEDFFHLYDASESNSLSFHYMQRFFRFFAATADQELSIDEALERCVSTMASSNRSKQLKSYDLMEFGAFQEFLRAPESKELIECYGNMIASCKRQMC